MFVTTPMKGFAISQSARISLRWFAPISVTQISSPPPMPSSVSGSPMWLLRLPGVACTAKLRARIAAARSFVPVFPELPVIAMTRGFTRSRHAAASA